MLFLKSALRKFNTASGILVTGPKMLDNFCCTFRYNFCGLSLLCNGTMDIFSIMSWLNENIILNIVSILNNSEYTDSLYFEVEALGTSERRHITSCILLEYGTTIPCVSNRMLSIRSFIAHHLYLRNITKLYKPPYRSPCEILGTTIGAPFTGSNCTCTYCK